MSLQRFSKVFATTRFTVYGAISAMFLKLDGSGPLYRQVYRSLRGSILAGKLASGVRLPSTRALAREAGISRNTVLLGYDQLLAEGYVVGRTGSGTFVSFELPDDMLATAGSKAQDARPQAIRASVLSSFARRLVVVQSDVVLLQANIRYNFHYSRPGIEEFPYETWRRLLARRARTTSARSFTYGPPEGISELREVIADYLRRARGAVCDPDQIIIVNGSQQALDLVARVLLDTGDRIVIEDPHYLGAREVFRAAGAKFIPGTVDEEGLDAENLPRGAKGARLVYVTPSHQFPTGAIMSLARRLALLDWARTTGAYVVEDDYDSEYRYGGRPVEAVQALDRGGRVIYVGTLSKTIFPSLRLGYLLLPRPLVKPFVAAKYLADRHTPTLAQEVLTDFIREGDFERHLRRARIRNAARRSALLSALKDYFGERVSVEGANAGLSVLAWLRDVSPRKLDNLIGQAARAGVGVYSVAPYYLGAPKRAGLLLGYAAMTEDEIRAGMRQLAQLPQLRTHRSDISRLP